MNLKQVLLTLLGALISSSLLAGPPDMKQVAPVPPPCDFGVGWYAALEGGANVYQSFDGSRTRTLPNGDEIALHVDHNVGGYGGIKLGYVFGRGTIRFALEEEMFYNGLSTNAHVSLNNREIANSSNLINSGVFLTNFLIRFGSGRFQPYIGAGPGAYYAATAGADVTIHRAGANKDFSTGGGASSGSFAFDVVAGADYYFNCKTSVFMEYHFLDYVALDVGNGNHQFGQQLVGAGVRFHF